MHIQTLETQDDFAVAARLIHEYFLQWGLETIEDEPELVDELANIEKLYCPPEGSVLVARLDDVPAGVVGLKRFDERSCLMKRMFVRPAHRGRGVARCLAIELMFVAEKLGYERMLLDTPEDNAPALRLYRSLGFADTAPYQEPGHDHWHDNWSFLEIELPPSDDVWFEWTKQLLETAYLSTDNIYRQSGNTAGTAERWELTRGIVGDAIHRDGTFLDVGCANGLLMESVERWCSDRGFKIEPHGLDISERLAEVARARLPRWADHINVGNSWTWHPPRSFDFVALRGAGGVPDHLREAHVRRIFDLFVGPGGRLIVHWSGLRDGYDEPWPEILRAWGFEIGGELVRRDAAGEPQSRAAWIDKP